MSSSPSPSTSKLTNDDAHVAEEKDTTPPADEKEPQSDSEEMEEDGTQPNTEENTPAPASASSAPTDAAQWQAVWSPEYNAYYFYNPATQRTTWTNPLVPADTQQQQQPAEAEQQEKEGEEGQRLESESAPSMQQPQMSAIAAQNAAIEATALAQGIDPLLARLDPSLVASATAPGQTVPGSLPTFTAQFNARTGRFASVSSSSSSLIPSSSSAPVRTPAHLSEYERAKRMSSFYFDVDKWEEDLAKRGGRLMGEEGEGEGAEGSEGGKKRKRPSKKDIERFKEQKKQKKIAKTAWLRT